MLRVVRLLAACLLVVCLAPAALFADEVATSRIGGTGMALKAMRVAPDMAPDAYREMLEFIESSVNAARAELKTALAEAAA